MKLQLKKPSELDRVVKVESIHISANQNGIGWYCPDCGLEVEWIANDWPIDVRIHCDDAYCDCVYIIPNNVEIVE